MNAELPWATMWVANRYGVASTKLQNSSWAAGARGRALPGPSREMVDQAVAIAGSNWTGSTACRPAHSRRCLLDYASVVSRSGWDAARAERPGVHPAAAGARATRSTPISTRRRRCRRQRWRRCAPGSASISLCRCSTWPGCGQAVTGNLGFSLQRTGEPVLRLVLIAVGPTVLLMAAGLSSRSSSASPPA